MDKYTIFEHTADIGLTARGNTLGEAYENVALGMFSIICDIQRVRERVSRTVTIQENDYESMVFEWLNRLIYYFDTEMLLFSRFHITDFSATSLTAVCFGEKYDAQRHILYTGIKSATYHQLAVDTLHNTINVILDI